MADFKRNYFFPINVQVIISVSFLYSGNVSVYFTIFYRIAWLIEINKQFLPGSFHSHFDPQAYFPSFLDLVRTCLMAGK